MHSLKRRLRRGTVSPRPFVFATVRKLDIEFISVPEERNLQSGKVTLPDLPAFADREATKNERLIRNRHLPCPKPAILLTAEIERSVLKDANSALLCIFQRKRPVPCTRCGLAGAAKQS